MKQTLGLRESGDLLLRMSAAVLLALLICQPAGLILLLLDFQHSQEILPAAVWPYRPILSRLLSERFTNNRF